MSFGRTFATRKIDASTLVEMVVAVAVSSVIILAITALLSESLALSASGQNELIAVTLADLLLENARTMPYAALEKFADNSPRAILINSSTVGQQGPDIRKIQAQLSFVDDKCVYGEVDPLTGSLVTANRWNLNNNNSFRGSAYITVSDSTSITTVPSLKILVEVSSPGVYSSSKGEALTKKVKRIAFVFKGGSQF